MAKPSKQGIERIIDATKYSMKGFKAVWRFEAAFRQELTLAVIGVVTAFFVARSIADFLWLILPLFIVLIAELANSAIEATVDRISSEHHELSGRAKDIGSAMVFVSLVLTVLIWTVILIGYFGIKLI
ncbi:MAG: diacylglycerol kinase [Gammaproteobacteria bacterium]|nr:MAG: diacylglycerol kinase [Gammaproteobacteria bacterium]